MSDPTVLYSVDGHVATISLNRPEAMNASSRQLRADLQASMEAAENDANVRVVVFTGEGRGFSAGADLKEGFLEHHPTVTEHILKDHKPLIEAIGSSSKTYIAALHGATAGISIAYAFNCDLVVMGENAFVYAPFAAISLIPDGGISFLLVQALGYRRAYEAAVEGKRLSASECEAVGLANRVVADDQVRAEAASWAKHLAETVAPLSLRYTKAAMREALTEPMARTIQKEAELQQHCITSEDSQEGIGAFLEKRKPVFRGK